jgi:hypothetical protein
MRPSPQTGQPGQACQTRRVPECPFPIEWSATEFTVTDEQAAALKAKAARLTEAVQRGRGLRKQGNRRRCEQHENSVRPLYARVAYNI